MTSGGTSNQSRALFERWELTISDYLAQKQLPSFKYVGLVSPVSQLTFLLLQVLRTTFGARMSLQFSLILFGRRKNVGSCRRCRSTKMPQS